MVGRKPILKPEQEKEVVERILRLAGLAFPVTPTLLRCSVYTFCQQNNIKHPFNEFRGMAGKDWLRGFLKRHPEIARRKAQNLNEARAQKLNKFIVDDYFTKLKTVLDAENLMHKPERIYNLDEKGIRLCLHKSATVMAGKGSNRVHSRGKEHGESVTVVGCVNALGNTVPPMILFKGKILKPEWYDDLPPGSTIKMTEKGSMTNATFVSWLNHFAQFKPAGKF